MLEIPCRELADGRVDSEQDFLPAGLEEMVPDLFLAVVVSGVDPSRLNGHDAVRLMQARERLGSHHDAGRLEAMAEVAYSPPGDAASPVERCFEAVEYSAVG